MRRTSLAAALAVAMLAASCSSTSGGSGAGTTAETVQPDDTVLLEALSCDPLDERACLLPWPNDAFTLPDPTTPTGRRLGIDPEDTPANTAGVHIDVADQNRADGFSPGSSILAFVPGLDAVKTGIAPSTDIGSSLRADAPVVLLDTTTGQRVAYWGELDATAPASDRVLIVHPAAALPEGHHFVVALRDLVDGQSNAIERSSAFQAAIDGEPEPQARAHSFAVMLAQLATVGVSTPGLFLAWDFTVASQDSLSKRVLKIRDEAYAALGQGAPAFTVTSTADAGSVRTVDGTYEVPNYLTGDGGPGTRFALDAAGLPTRNVTVPTLHVPFRCVLPLAAAGPVPAIVYGHGLMGSRAEVDSLSFAAASGVAAACATDEIGMSSADVANLAKVLGDLSHFPEQADRLQQGLLNQQFLGRLLNSPQGFVSATAFRAADGRPLVANYETQFVGNSQGGILGGAASAISSEWSRVVLGVPGIDYSLLLPRSSDWPQFAAAFDAAYTDPADRLIALQLAQLLWDRGENDGYAQHLTSQPYPSITAKQVLLVEAFGDHQVANVSTEVLARTIRAELREPVLAPGRSADVHPLWGLTAYTPGTTPTAVLVEWDYGTPAPPTVNLPPSGPAYGNDPHGAGAREPKVLRQALTFLFNGTLDDVCAGQPCISSVLSR